MAGYARGAGMVEGGMTEGGNDRWRRGAGMMERDCRKAGMTEGGG